ncbi:MAG TPA: hypothetical protein VGN61_06235 [Verrucomicrobiae bacterium]|jgi:hypothetical protein
MSGPGYYSLCLAGSSLYSTRGEIHSAFSTDGLTNFWTGGVVASGDGLEYVKAGSSTVFSISGVTNVRVAGLVSGNLTFTESRNGSTGVAFVSDAPTVSSSSDFYLSDSGGSPVDFAAAPTGLTAYISDANPTVSHGGIQRWDYTSGGWKKSYTMFAGTGLTVGITGLAVDFSGFAAASPLSVGAVIYAITAETNANRLIRIVDNGTNSTATMLIVAEPNQILQGVRFAPTTVPVSIVASPINEVRQPGQTGNFSVTAAGSGPITYQWQFDGSNIYQPGAILSIDVLNQNLRRPGLHPVEAL